ncbi:hypothetical protein Ferp_0563 [Ferroglobus placidus DSM 10642]|uniref:Uncharacterized protein n=1 Tax=Ferroglobus placidus (strain DSM 10642 / AEDII12DO) TaxID=589924 RepID=D3S3A3_FERPA|nr:hypothetical protein [Ferroglobus placidus]ADC64736.1 hypothetical protein Ferp_0563 [Ferroglobus placidus DSM 10642]
MTAVPSGAAAAAAGGAAARAAASAQKFTFGFLIFEPEEFLKLVKTARETDGRAVVILVKKRKGVVNRKDEYIYAAKYADFTILTRSETPLALPSKTELIVSRDIVLPVAVMHALKML